MFQWKDKDKGIYKNGKGTNYMIEGISIGAYNIT